MPWAKCCARIEGHERPDAIDAAQSLAGVNETAVPWDPTGVSAGMKDPVVALTPVPITLQGTREIGIVWVPGEVLSYG